MRVGNYNASQKLGPSVLVRQVKRGSMCNIRIARDEAIGDDDQGTTDPSCIRERQGLRKHTNTNQKGGGIEKLCIPRSDASKAGNDAAYCLAESALSNPGRRGFCGKSVRLTS